MDNCGLKRSVMFTMWTWTDLKVNVGPHEWTSMVASQQLLYILQHSAHRLTPTTSLAPPSFTPGREFLKGALDKVNGEAVDGIMHGEIQYAICLCWNAFQRLRCSHSRHSPRSLINISNENELWWNLLIKHLTIVLNWHSAFFRNVISWGIVFLM